MGYIIFTVNNLIMCKEQMDIDPAKTKTVGYPIRRIAVWKIYFKGCSVTFLIKYYFLSII